MKLSKVLMSLLSVLLLAGLFTGCTSKKDTPAAGSDPKGPEGEITVITQRTDIVDTVFQDYAKEFNKIYPNVKVNFQALADYDGQIKIRMGTRDYGDVLLIPGSIPIEELPNFFEPLGTYEEMKNKYTGIEERTVDGNSYGIPIAMVYSGVIYNKKVFKEAGITQIPKTPDQFQKALQQIKDKTKAVPLFTNYASGWALTQWESSLATVAGTKEYVNVTQPTTDDNFTKGQPHYELYKVLYDAAKNGLIEKDPTTTDWETSKADLAQGKIGTMVLGSWAIDQIKSVASNKDDIGFMPFPTNASKVLVPLAGDFNLGINVNSENKEAARAWVDWFTEKSNYAVEQAGSISPLKGAAMPAILKQYENEGVVFEALTPSPKGQEGIVDKIDKMGEIGLWQPDFKKRIIEAAVGNRSESYDTIMKDLNDAWVKARAEVAAKEAK
ncbi:ABC-type glycerol-3-phosphate transport system substrate-binding protein [Paenibacillus jamilae]|jgi:ABC-type glycerol-3-phosphate transport system substrate-binding protein|uniref:ABC transporter substrate-binding protein n=1 Tax=Paenibacillus polymyxa TaxID=1406 RepID=UPI000D2FF4FC|nr:extracellular solute-binding protein [Paenibacillus polymyxa]MDP9677546.1 ABC-type glycerol-3-phosphate transport system substrate-binding protein [Paenibacillus jamilae]MBY0022127.1 extracellular solute-binding protein [Paenibacillus polymyxa]MBY0057970.1 extracellular solute-binding protein [Paenibacillus polymyxa]MBY0068583.1 extracellular solute-binding protein [Paenibacillus polymyxa]MBY0079150.1 extracellular solute-binding protein [Paenibacillus polymyxa]